MEVFGKQKRDILVSRVEKARNAQEETKVQFQSALEQFSSVVKVPGSELQTKYNKLKAELDKSEASAKNVHNRVADVESVCKALFKEWNSELDQYTNKDLRRKSEDKLKQTQARCDQLTASEKSTRSFRRFATRSCSSNIILTLRPSLRFRVSLFPLSQMSHRS
jgi:transketolase